MLGLSPSLLLRGLIILLVLGLGTALYLEIKKAGANEQKIVNLNDQIRTLNEALQREQAIRAADQKALGDRDATIDQINASHRQQVTQLEKALKVVSPSDECIDKTMPAKIQEAVFGPAGTK
ncbi:MAG TPA: hypothetical protein VNI58_02040 [Mariprofundaceae bacterium]|nr:hypothetical protein [Mariprofundaceae bacterium]